MKNPSLSIIVLAGLSIAFGIVSIIVYFSNGQNHYFLKKKLAIGAAIIAITSIASCIRPPVKCYAPARPPEIEYKDSSGNTYKIFLNEEQKINFNCKDVYYEEYCYKLVSEGEIICTGNCITNKDINGDIGNFDIILSDEILTGKYRLDIYAGNTEELGIKIRSFQVIEQ